MKEEWRDIPDWEGLYEASSMGRIRSLDRLKVKAHGRKGTIAPCWIKGRLLNPGLSTSGYLQVTLAIDDKRVTTDIHSVICRVFHGPRPKGFHAAHLDGDKKNNKSSNLRWKSPSDNAHDKNKHGTMLVGSRAPWSKLTEDIVRELRHDCTSTYSELEAKYGVNRASLHAAKTGKTWKHVI